MCIDIADGSVGAGLENWDIDAVDTVGKTWELTECECDVATEFEER